MLEKKINTPNKSFKNLLLVVLVVSFLIGGITGTVAGAISGSLVSKEFFPGLQRAFWGQLSQTPPPKQVVKVEESSATVEVVKKAQPAVISIIITKDLSKIYNLTGPDIFSFPDLFEFGLPRFRFSVPGAPQGEQEVGGGTGFIISPDGLILTNKHVVSDSEAGYTVLTNEGEKYEAEVLAQDPLNDIAIIKIDAKDLPVVELGDSDQLQIGQTIIAIGNSLSEYHNSATRGIISGIGRTITAGDRFGQAEVIEGAIQTDAAINPGNSGGPLLNLAGQVVGVSTAISREGQLIGFAIPINAAKLTIEQVLKHGRIIRPFLGVRYILITPQIAKANNLPVDYGALIVRGQDPTDLAVVPSSPADKAGLEENDIILELGGVKIDQEHTLAKEIMKYQPGDQVELKILKKGEEKIVSVNLVEMKE